MRRGGGLKVLSGQGWTVLLCSVTCEALRGIVAVRLENRSFLLRMPERKDHATFLWDTACSLSLSFSLTLFLCSQIPSLFLFLLPLMGTLKCHMTEGMQGS